MFYQKLIKLVLIALGIGLLGACASTSQPNNTQDICRLFSEKPKWYKAAKKSTQKWGGNIQLPMAIMYQESTFRRKAKPKRSTILGFIPGKRPSNAYGYAQALKSTWGEYERAVGSSSKRRDNFADAFDFIQWYINKSQKRNAISKWDYDAQYLNYHEGQGGYSRGTYLKKPWLLKTAARVEVRAKRYGSQLLTCQDQLNRMRTGWF